MCVFVRAYGMRLQITAIPSCLPLLFWMSLNCCYALSVLLVSVQFSPILRSLSLFRSWFCYWRTINFVRFFVSLYNWFLLKSFCHSIFTAAIINQIFIQFTISAFSFVRLKFRFDWNFSLKCVIVVAGGGVIAWSKNILCEKIRSIRLLGSTASFKLTTDRAIIFGKSYDFVVCAFLFIWFCAPENRHKWLDVMCAYHMRVCVYLCMWHDFASI